LKFQFENRQHLHHLRAQLHHRRRQQQQDIQQKLELAMCLTNSLLQPLYKLKPGRFVLEVQLVMYSFDFQPRLALLA
jgi:hypothetical protein